MSYEEYGYDFDDAIHEWLYQVYEKADAVLTLYRHYSDKYLENSERFMIDNCDFLLTVDENTFAAQYAELRAKPVTVCKSLHYIK